MKKLFALVVLLTLVTPAVAQENKTAEVQGVKLTEKPGILPDSPLYGLKRAAERIRLALTFNDDSKIKLELKYAERRLAEAKEMVKKGKPDMAEKVIKDHEKYIQDIKERIERKREKMNCYNETSERCKAIGNIEELLNETTSRHVAVLTELLQKVPESAKPAIEHALNVSTKYKVRIRHRVEERAQLGEQKKENVTEVITKIKEKVKEKKKEIKESAEISEMRENLSNCKDETLESLNICKQKALKSLDECKKESPENIDECKEEAMKELNECMEEAKNDFKACWITAKQERGLNESEIISEIQENLVEAEKTVNETASDLLSEMQKHKEEIKSIINETISKKLGKII